MARYFKKYEYSNTTFDQFIENLDSDFKEINYPCTSREWFEMWIGTSGSNTLSSNFNP